MKNLSWFSLLFILSLVTSCATNNNKKNTFDDIDKITEQDFKAPRMIKFESSKDRFELLSSTNLSTASESADDLKNDSVKDDNLFYLARECFKLSGKSEFSLEIIKEIENSTRNYQEYPPFWNQVGNCYQAIGNSRKALLYYNYAIELNPNYGVVFNNLGILYYRLGEFQKAMTAFEKAIKINPFSIVPRINKSSLFVQFDQFDLALLELNKLQMRNPDDERIQSLVAQALSQKGDWSKLSTLCSSKKNFRDEFFHLSCSLGFLKLNLKKDSEFHMGKIHSSQIKESSTYKEISLEVF